MKIKNIMIRIIFSIILIISLSSLLNVKVYAKNISDNSEEQLNIENEIQLNVGIADVFFEELQLIEEVPLYIEVEPYDMYVSAYSGLRARTNPDVQEDNTITILKVGTIVTVIGETDNWAVINVDGQIAYINKNYIQKDLPETATYNTTWTGEVLNKSNGKVYGPSGYETYYNLPMDNCVKAMNRLGYYGTVWTRSDGVKMWNEYVMVSANLKTHPKGSLVETSLGTGIVVDTGGFVSNGSGIALDIATAW